MSSQDQFVAYFLNVIDPGSSASEKPGFLDEAGGCPIIQNEQSRALQNTKIKIEFRQCFVVKHRPRANLDLS